MKRRFLNLLQAVLLLALTTTAISTLIFRHRIWTRIDRFSGANNGNFIQFDSRQGLVGIVLISNSPITPAGIPSYNDTGKSDPVPEVSVSPRQQYSRNGAASVE